MVYSLLIIIIMLLLSMMTIISVAYQRHQRLEDQTTDLQNDLFQGQRQIKDLQKRLENCDTLPRTTPAIFLPTPATAELHQER